MLDICHMKDWLLIFDNFSKCFGHFRFAAQEYQVGRSQ